MTNILFIILELIGTVAFSISGVTVALEKKMDVFGVAILGMTTAVGGGIIRDLILGQTPPAAFKEPVYPLLAIVVAIICFIQPVRRHMKENDIVVLVMDSLGLGIFTVVGVAAGIEVAETNYLLAIFVGVLTGVGGGVLRDVFAGNTPYIFVKHFYACASIIGAIVCVALWHFFGENVSMLLGAGVIIVLRLCAAKFRWDLPT